MSRARGQRTGPEGVDVGYPLSGDSIKWELHATGASVECAFVDRGDGHQHAEGHRDGRDARPRTEQ